MKNRNQTCRSLIAIMLLLPLFSINCSRQTPAPIPSLKEQGTAKQFIVDGKPFIALCGELGNNNATNIDYLKPIWPVLTVGNLNSVIAGISWAMVEPEEGKYNFDIVGAVINDARKNNLKLIFIWFASWKNGKSSYIPDWVKKDYVRFPRIKINETETIELITPLSEENRNADARAFAALMKYIKEVDSRQRTVIMMQVENEVGVLLDSRDRSAIANEAYKGPVPQELMSYIEKNKDNLVPELKEVWKANGSKMSGTWEEVFGPGKPKGLVMPVRNLVPPMTQEEQDEALVTYPFYSDEVFMAWYYSTYINYIVEAGKAEYPIPMFVNAWLKQREHSWPGTYPSGGCLPHVFDIYHAGGPSIDFLAPDLYRPDFANIAEQFTRSGNPLFIPETSGGAQGAAIFIMTAPGEFYIGGSGMTITFSQKNPEFKTGLATVEEGTFVQGKWIPGRRLAGDDTGQGSNLRLGAGYNIQKVSLYSYK
ncbi:MAG: DUF5597 domain-containing protein [Bacteroidales bacterium]|nr:DUF5597 domain-containing protein [Bacteroidales bacterium]